MFSIFKTHPLYFKISEALLHDSKNCFVSGLSGSSSAFMISNIYESSEKHIICILPEKEEAANFYSDLISILNDSEVLFFPSSFRKKYNASDINTANSVIRTRALEIISSSEKPLLIVTYPEAITEKAVNREILSENTLILHKGEKVSTSFKIGRASCRERV